jgi:hypothetical protein
MRKTLCLAAFMVLLGMSLLLAFARSASAQETFTFVCETASGPQTFTDVTKPNPSSAIFKSGSTILVSAIGASITGGTAQSSAVACTVNGEGPFPFLLVG